MRKEKAKFVTFVLVRLREGRRRSKKEEEKDGPDRDFEDKLVRLPGVKLKNYSIHIVCAAIDFSCDIVDKLLRRALILFVSGVFQMTLYKSTIYSEYYENAIILAVLKA